MYTEYMMRAKNTALGQLVYWNALTAPDFVGTDSIYNPVDLTDIVLMNNYLDLSVASIDTGLGSFTTITTVAYAATVNVDFSLITRMLKIETLAGNLTLTTANLVAGKGVTIRFLADGTNRNLVFPAWKFYGSAAPATITAGKTGVLALLCWGATDADVDAVWVESV